MGFVQSFPFLVASTTECQLVDGHQVYVLIVYYILLLKSIINRVLSIIMKDRKLFSMKTVMCRYSVK